MWVCFLSTYHQIISFVTKGDCDIIDITKKVESIVTESGLSTGLCTIFCPGSTCAVTSIEYEEGLLKDFPEAMERIAPQHAKYEHDKRWGDGNGHAHIRASVVGPSFIIPFIGKKLTLGTWQQVVFIDYDNRPRNRNLEILILGE